MPNLKIMLCFIVIVLVTHFVGTEQVKYQPNWASLDQRPLPSWYDEAKFGIFMHWGVFSVPSFTGAWFWWYWKSTKTPAIVDFMKKNYPPGFTYADFAPMFKAEFFDPNQWADIIAASGAKYVVLTTKHHEGFSNWPSKVSWNWNSMDVGPRRDLVGDFASAIRNRTKVHLGLYHSLFEWFNPLYLEDKANKFKTQSYVKEKVLPALYELVTSYKPEVLWSDGDWEAPDTYWNSTQFLAWLYNSSPVKDRVVVNDRWGKGDTCHHGGFMTCSDRYNPGVLQKRKWENAMTVDKKAWGYRRQLNMADIFSMDELVTTLVETVSCGGNLLMNVGPTADGRIVPIFEERLRQMGRWLKVNGAAIYSSTPWSHQNDTVTAGVWYTSKKTPTGTTVYAITLKWPQNTLTLGAVTPNTQTRVTLLGHQGAFQFSARPSGGMDVDVAGVSGLPCQWGWVFQLENVTSRSKSTTLKWTSLRQGTPIVPNYRNGPYKRPGAY